MPRQPLPEDQVRESLTIRLPRWLLAWLASRGDVRKEIEAIILERYKKEKS